VKGGAIDLDDAVFGAPCARDILHRVVTWQLAKRAPARTRPRRRGEVSGSTAKLYRQKGTGAPAMGSKRANIFRGGGGRSARCRASHATTCPRRCGGWA
jgi:large subunit ribosomal protein L4